MSKVPFRQLLIYDGSENPRYWLVNIKNNFERKFKYFLFNKTRVAYATRNLKNNFIIKRR
jgi:hypothetical protein